MLRPAASTDTRWSMYEPLRLHCYKYPEPRGASKLFLLQNKQGGYIGEVWKMTWHDDTLWEGNNRCYWLETLGFLLDFVVARTQVSGTKVVTLHRKWWFRRSRIMMVWCLTTQLQSSIHKGSSSCCDERSNKVRGKPSAAIKQPSKLHRDDMKRLDDGTAMRHKLDWLTCHQVSTPHGFQKLSYSRV